MAAFHVGNHICGVYYVVSYRRTYLSPIKLESHTIVSPVSFSTQLQETYKVPESVPQLRYTFPLYDGVTVSGYTISYADTVLTGVVKQNDDAKKRYQDAVDRGETAGLLESLPAGVFGVTLCNVPAQTELVVDITYCGELKHDAAIDGLRYTLPTSIAPRYGSYPGTLLSANVAATSMQITVDIDLGGKSAIRKVQSPSHPIAVTMGEMSLTNCQSGTKLFSPAQASATLSRRSTELGSDFVLQVVIDDLSRPQAILEVHPSIPNQRAIMATMVPKFVLESANPEIVFIADQSGSMVGSKNTSLVKALKVFLKSLPMGVRFNICAFGNRFQFLWDTSQAYNEDNVNHAIDFVSGFHANYGGTELLEPIEEALKRRLKDMPFEILVLTDGQIWAEEQVFDYINQEIEAGADARIFALGIGEDVSHTLVEGLARAGNGFAQFVTQNEDTDQKVMRMLKGALYAHTKDYKLEVHYSDDQSSDDDDFEIIEKVQDCLNITVTNQAAVEPQTSKSFFDTSANVDQAPAPKDRYAHLPLVDTPKLLQTPSNIPPLFPFNRSTVYLLLDETSAHKHVKSVTLRASSANGPLELEIPISATTHGISIHQMAARKATQELEQGRGWLHSATIGDADQTLVKKHHASRFDEIVEREAVRLGEKFQVVSKWTSFVAVQAETSEEEEQNTAPERQASKPLAREVFASLPARRSAPSPSPSFSGAPLPPAGSWGGGGGSVLQMQQTQQMSQQQQQPMMMRSAARTSAPGQSATKGFSFGGKALFANSSSTTNVFGNSSGNSSQAPSGGGALYGSSSALAPPPAPASANSAHAFGGLGASSMQLPDGLGAEEEKEGSDEDLGFALMDDEDPRAFSARHESIESIQSRKNQARSKSGSVLHELIDLQTFSGSWKFSHALLDLLGIEDDREKVLQAFGARDEDVLATSLVVAYLEFVLHEKKDVWEMVVGKARGWLAGKLGEKEKVEEMVGRGRGCLPTTQ